jgi:apolipoprotein N-acyltransferase
MSSNDYTETKLPLWAQAALAAGAGLLLTLGYALHPLWWAPWLAPALLIPATGGGRGRAWLMGALAGAVSVISVIGYYLDFSAVTAAIVFVLRTLAWGGAATLTRAAWRRLPAGAAVFVLPVVIAALEEITLTVSVHGAVGSLAYSQMPLLPVIQAASWGGTPAVTFLLLLPGSLIGGLLLRRPPARPALAAAGLALAVLAACGAYATWRLAAPAPAGRQAVALIASDRFRGIPEDWKAVWAVYRPEVDRAAVPGSLIVLPEKIALLDGPEAEAAAAEVRAAAMKTQATLVVGLEVHADGIYRNRALVARPDGSTAWYDKQRMVPVFEDRDVPGHGPLVLGAGPLTLGAAICKDMHIPSIGREYAGKAALMAVPAWDFGQDGWMGARMTGMRGIESGYAVARSARNGLAGAYDAYGRIVAEAPSGPQTTVTARLAAARIDTPYGHVGEAFGWICAALSLGLIAWLRLARRRN